MFLTLGKLPSLPGTVLPSEKNGAESVGVISLPALTFLEAKYKEVNTRVFRKRGVLSQSDQHGLPTGEFIYNQ